MKSDFADFSVDYDLGERKYKQDGMLLLHKNYISEEQREYADNPTKYPVNCAQKLFNKLEIDLINNSGNTWAMIRVLVRYRDLVEDFKKRTPNTFVVGSLINFLLEKQNLSLLYEAIKVEDRVLFNSMAFTREVIYKIFDDEIPTYSEELIITKNTEAKLYNSLVDFTLKHLTCNNKFKRKYKFKKPEGAMLTQPENANV